MKIKKSLIFQNFFSGENTPDVPLKDFLGLRYTSKKPFVDRRPQKCHLLTEKFWKVFYGSKTSKKPLDRRTWKSLL